MPVKGPGRSELTSGIAISAEKKLAPNSYARAGGAAHTDASGHYRLDGLAPGDYIVFMAGRKLTAHGADGSTVGGSGLPIYAPQTVRPSEATIVHITGAETHRLDFVPTQARSLHSVHGTVAVEADALPRMTLVRMYPSGEGGLTAAVPLDAANGFTFEGVPDGVYTVTVDFPPTREFVGADLISGTIRMRVRPAPYTSVSQEVHVAGDDVSDVALHPSHILAASAP